MAELLLYCIGGASLTPPDGLRRVVHRELAAIVSPVSEPARVATPSRAELLEYERVIRSSHALADVLPMRFGGLLPDEQAVCAHLDERRAVYLRALTRIAGCVELEVRARLSPPPPPVTTEDVAEPAIRSGADYLQARQRRYSAENRLRDQCEALERALLSKVAPLCREHRLELSPPRCSLYFLVPRDQVSAFRSTLSPTPDVGPMELTLSGPWPPFNFVE
jgi:hypothetical protein